MKMAVKDKITAAVIFIISIAGYIKAGEYEMGGASTFPKAIFMGSIVLSVALFLAAQFDFYKGKEKKENINIKRMGMIIGITILYFVLIDTVGYFIVTPLFLFLLSIILGYKNKKILFLYPLFFSIFLYLVFRSFLNVPLPMGILS